jgi:hypothetical protein
MKLVGLNNFFLNMCIEKGIEAEVTLKNQNGHMYVIEVDMVPRTAEDEQKMMELGEGCHKRGFALFGKYDRKQRVMKVDIAFRPKNHD